MDSILITACRLVNYICKAADQGRRVKVNT